MKRIRKKAAPPAFVEWARSFGRPNSVHDWKHLPGDLSNLLHLEMSSEQGGLCCYCSMVLRSGGHIEHFHARHVYLDRMFDYGNLHLSCMGALEHAGREPVDPAVEHCGHAKDAGGMPAPVVDPQAADCESYFRYAGNGAIRATKGEVKAGLAKQTIDALGLDCEPLRRMRAAAIDQALKDIQVLPRAEWQRRYLEPDAEGRFAEFQPVIRYQYNKDWYRFPDPAASAGQ